VTAVEHLLLQITQADIASDNATLSLKQLTFQMLNFLFHQSHGRICDCWSNYSQSLKLPDSAQSPSKPFSCGFLRNGVRSGIYLLLQLSKPHSAL